MLKPTKWKIAAYVAAWLGALFATDPTLKLWPLAYMFPLGLVEFFIPPGYRDAPAWFVMGSVVGLYVVHGIFYFRAKNKPRALILFLILVGLLVCNVSGCRGMNHPH